MERYKVIHKEYGEGMVQKWITKTFCTVEFKKGWVMCHTDDLELIEGGKATVHKGR